MRSPLPLLFLAFLAAAACGGQSQQAAPALTTTSSVVALHSAANPAASFARYRTFTFGPAEGPPAGYKTSARTAEVRRRLQPLIAAMLVERGYAPASDKADLVIMFGSGRREVDIHESSSMGAEWLPDDENADFVEGSIVIDAFDAATGHRVWHGANRANIDPERIDDLLLQRSVHDLLVAFPAVTSSAPRAP